LGREIWRLGLAGGGIEKISLKVREVERLEVVKLVRDRRRSGGDHSFLNPNPVGATSWAHVYVLPWSKQTESIRN
jgi:hypothetical protein